MPRFERVDMENPTRPLLEAATTGAIIDTFRDVHRAFGFGYREYIYSLAMERDPTVQLPVLDKHRGWPRVAFWSRATVLSCRLRKPVQASAEITV